jgi:threonine dehydrogenase-like Zn-dependent dehydrogenase
VSPMITGVYPLDDIQQAFETAMDRRRSVKVHLKFN